MKTLIIYSNITNHKHQVTLRTRETVTAKILDRAKSLRLRIARRKDVPDRLVDRQYHNETQAEQAAVSAGFQAYSSQWIVEQAKRPF